MMTGYHASEPFGVGRDWVTTDKEIGGVAQGGNDEIS
jgi:hypothetical protein